MSNIDKQALREAAEMATESDWIVDAHEGWHAVIPVADAVNGNYIIAEFQGPESKRNRDYVAAANPATVLALLDELEAAEKRIGELSQKADIYDMLRQDYELHGSLVEFVDWQAKRIAELEAREVKLPELCVGVVQGGHAVMVPYAAGHWFNKTAILEMLADAGINIAAAGKGE